MAIRSAGWAEDYFVQIYQETFERLSKYVFFKAPNLPDAEDVTATVYADFFRYVVQKEKQPENPISYLMQMANHELSKLYVKRVAAVSFDDEESGLTETVADESNLSEAVFDAFQSDELWAAVGKLSDAEQRVLVAKFRYDMTFVEISEALGRGESAVKLSYYRSLKKLKNILESL